jgi:Flp pilus assembly pilin Flp
MSRRKGVYKLAATSRGQTMAEYALILATIAIVSAAFVQSAGTIITSLVHNVINLL